MGTVTLIQYIHPSGRVKPVAVDLPDEVCKMAEDQVLTCECLPHHFDHVAFYSHRKGVDPEETAEMVEVAVNGPGADSPAKVLERLIRRVADGAKMELLRS